MAKSEARAQELIGLITKAKDGHGKSSDLVAELKKIRNWQLGQSKIRAFTDKLRVDEGMQDRLHGHVSNPRRQAAQRATNYLVTNAMEHMASGEPLRRPTTWERVKNFLAKFWR